jgi:hypothetical protein
MRGMAERMNAIHPQYSCFAAGIVTTLVSSEQLDRLQAIAKELKLNLSEVPEPPMDMSIDIEEGDVETAKKNLDDLYNLL